MATALSPYTDEVLEHDAEKLAKAIVEMMHNTTPAARARALEILSKLVGLSRASNYNMVKRGEFPAQRKPSANCVAWRADEVSAWIATRISEPTDAALRILDKPQLKRNQTPVA